MVYSRKCTLRFFWCFLVAVAAIVISVPHLSAFVAEQTHDEFYRAKVTEIVEEGQNDVAGLTSPYQILDAELLSGSKKGTTIRLEYGTNFSLEEVKKLRRNEKIVVGESLALGEVKYFVVDSDRMGPMVLIGLIFFACTVFFGRKKGFTAIIGMLLSVLVLALFVIPQITAGRDPLWVSLLGAFVITLFSLYVAHGFHKRTTIALISTLLTLGLSAVLAKIFVVLTKLSGMASEETMFLQLGAFSSMNFQGLLLGGIIIGALGVLDDITTGQVAVVHELKEANPNLSPRELFRRGLSVGQEHIASLVNTLVLAYVGASFPLLLLFTTSSDIPFWVSFNSEYIAEEVIRTLVGSTALIFAVPIATFLAARFLHRRDFAKHHAMD